MENVAGGWLLSGNFFHTNLVSFFKNKIETVIKSQFSSNFDFSI